MDKGLLHIYTGDGKGKTSAAAGLAVRALGQGLRVAFVQFLKGGTSGEVAALEKLGARVLAPKGSRKFVFQMDASEKLVCRQRQEAVLAQAAAMRDDFDLMVLDESIGAAGVGMLDADELLRFAQDRPAGLELVLTGRDAPPALLALADYVTEMRCVKHPYEAGVQARRGIEF